MKLTAIIHWILTLVPLSNARQGFTTTFDRTLRIGPDQNDVPTLDSLTNAPTFFPSGAKNFDNGNTVNPSDSPRSFLHTDNLVPHSAKADSPNTRAETYSASILPSTVPSSINTLASSIPSSIQNKVESTNPSSPPSTGFAVSPTASPSFHPSDIATVSPTTSCYDDISYLSPINELSCSDHASTDCIAWRFVGLNVTELGELVNSCPVSCSIRCGTFQLVDTKLSFVISGVSGLIDYQTQELLQKVSLVYLENFVKSKIASECVFVLDKIELRSQELIITRRNLRNLEDLSNLQIRLVLSLLGFYISDDSSVVDDWLVEGVDSDGFTTKLRLSNAFYANAYVSSAVTEFPRAVPEEQITDSSGSDPSKKATIAVSVLAGISAFVVLIGAVYLAKRRFFDDGGDEVIHYGNSFGSEIVSHVYRLRDSVQSSHLDKEDSISLASTEHHENHLHSLRVLGSPTQSLRRLNDEKSINGAIDRAFSAESGESEHPMAYRIPPMVVIDNIDDDSPKKSKKKPEKNASGVPLKRVTASEQFKEALALSFEQGTSLDAFREYDSYSQQFLEPYSILHASNYLHPSRCEGDNETTSINSNFVKASKEPNDSSHRRALSSSALDNMQVPNQDFKTCMESDWTKVGLESPSVAFTGRNSFESLVGATENGMSTEVTPGGSYRVVDSPNLYPVSDRPAALNTHVRGNMKRSLSSAKLYALNRNTSRRVNSVGIPLTRLPHPSPIQTTIGLIPDASAKEKVLLSGHPSLERRLSRGSLNSCENADENHITFYAPSRSKIGLELQSDSECGSRVDTVKDYSPLYGHVRRGDRIITVDGTNTSNMTPIALSAFLDCHHRDEGLFEIKISRPDAKNNSSPLHVNANSCDSHGSSCCDHQLSEAAEKIVLPHSF